MSEQRPILEQQLIIIVDITYYLLLSIFQTNCRAGNVQESCGTSTGTVTILIGTHASPRGVSLTNSSSLARLDLPHDTVVSRPGHRRKPETLLLGTDLFISALNLLFFFSPPSNQQHHSCVIRHHIQPSSKHHQATTSTKLLHQVTVLATTQYTRRNCSNLPRSSPPTSLRNPSHHRQNTLVYVFVLQRLQKPSAAHAATISHTAETL